MVEMLNGCCLSSIGFALLPKAIAPRPVLGLPQGLRLDFFTDIGTKIKQSIQFIGSCIYKKLIEGLFF